MLIRCAAGNRILTAPSVCGALDRSFAVPAPTVRTGQQESVPTLTVTPRANRLAATIVAALAFVASAAAAAAADLTVFGDSYSVPIHNGSPTWVKQIEGSVGRVHDFAKSGAVAASVGSNTFANQIKRWTSAGRPLGNTVVYLGFNDVGGSLDKARAGYQAGVDALVKAGANAHGNRLILVVPHDVGSIPLYNKSSSKERAYRSQTIQLGSIIRSIGSRSNATVVDMLPVFDKVVDNPKSYGFTNVTTADHAHSATTALYDDTVHFGKAGQAIIMKTIRPRLGSSRKALVAEATQAPAPATIAVQAVKRQAVVVQR
jgi:phospholipase/lecithinase/hemolysin